MKVLLLHQYDSLPTSHHWDLIVDLGKAPPSTYQNWGRKCGCKVISLYDFALEIDDLYHIKNLLQSGMGQLTDSNGIDWWSVLCLEFIPELQQILLLRRLARDLPQGCELYSSRADSRSLVLQDLVGGVLVNLEGFLRGGVRRFNHYSDVAKKFSTNELLQISLDKFDQRHAMRGRFAKRQRVGNGPFILLPSAYVNVSRTACSYATLLPEQQFLLVCARDSAKLAAVPENVTMISLNSYFVPDTTNEDERQLRIWDSVRTRLVKSAPEFASANAAGLLNRMRSLIPWGTAIGRAWARLLQLENITGCLCADDNNPYTRIALILSRNRGLPSLACHHGAFDSSAAMKQLDADFYLAKGEMERDYLRLVAGIPSEKLLSAGNPVSPPQNIASFGPTQRDWLVFFSEPYNVWGWRTEEIYRELLPRLSMLADAAGLKLVFKLHPFETVSGIRNFLHRYLGKAREKDIEILCGPFPEECWQRTKFAMTVQSTIAVECVARKVPVFLCGWLRDPISGYAGQFEKFGVGHLLKEVDEIEDIPSLLEAGPALSNLGDDLRYSRSAETLRNFFSGSYSSRLPAAAGV